MFPCAAAAPSRPTLAPAQRHRPEHVHVIRATAETGFSPAPSLREHFAFARCSPKSGVRPVREHVRHHPSI